MKNHAASGVVSRRLVRLLLLAVVSVGLFANVSCADMDTAWPTQHELELWDSAAVPILESDPWITSKSHAPASLLVVPMHAAFVSGEPAWKDGFHSMFNEFSRAVEADPGIEYSPEFLYLATEYLVLASEPGDSVDAPASLISIVTSATVSAWGESRGAIEQKLVATDIRPQHAHAITNQELLLMTSASNLVAAYSNLDRDGPRELQEATDTALRVLRTYGGSPEPGMWDFQTGIWNKHPGYRAAYLARTLESRQPTDAPAEVSIIIPKAQTLPLLLSSLLRAFPEGSFEARYVEWARLGLEQRVFVSAALPPDEEFPAWRLTNFLDGTEAPYFHPDPFGGREFRYPSGGLSGGFNLGWWIFLDTERVARVYWAQSARFPLPESVVDAYTLGDTVGRRELFIPPREIYDDGTAELIVRLAARIATERL